MIAQTQLKRIDYTGKDYNDIVNDVIEFLKTKYPDRWTDFEHDNAGKMLIEAFAYVGDLLLFYLDRQINECFLPTAKERQKLINLCKLIGYVIAPASPAQANVVFSLPAVHTSDVLIPKGTILTTAGKIKFELDSDVVIPADEITAEGSCTEGQTYKNTIGISNGEPGQSYYLLHKGIIAASAIYINKEKWNRVESLALSNPYGSDYVVDVDALGRAKISFGDGKLGQIPPVNSKIDAEYRVGGGIIGNVAPNTITRMQNVAIDKTGQTVLVRVNNPDSAAGGMEAETIEHARQLAPLAFARQGRLVTKEDYESIANSFSVENIGRFAKASAVIHERSGEANIIRIYALAQGNSGELVPPSEALIDAFLKAIDDMTMLTDYVDVVAAKVKKVDITAEIAIFQGFIAEDVVQNVKKDLISFLNFENRAMGQSLRYSDLYRIIDSSDGVDWVEISKPTGTIITSGMQEFIVAGEINITVVNNDG